MNALKRTETFDKIQVVTKIEMNDAYDGVHAKAVCFGSSLGAD